MVLSASEQFKFRDSFDGVVLCIFFSFERKIETKVRHKFIFKINNKPDTNTHIHTKKRNPSIKLDVWVDGKWQRHNAHIHASKILIRIGMLKLTQNPCLYNIRRWTRSQQTIDGKNKTKQKYIYSYFEHAHPLRLTQFYAKGIKKFVFLLRKSAVKKITRTHTQNAHPNCVVNKRHCKSISQLTHLHRHQKETNTHTQTHSYIQFISSHFIFTFMCGKSQTKGRRAPSIFLEIFLFFSLFIYFNPVFFVCAFAFVFVYKQTTSKRMECCANIYNSVVRMWILKGLVIFDRIGSTWVTFVYILNAAPYVKCQPTLIVIWPASS